MSSDHASDAQVSQAAAQALAVPAGLARESLPVPAAVAITDVDRAATATPAAPSVAPGDTTLKLQFVEATHQYIRDNIKLADQKATFFFTGATALLAFLYKLGVSDRWRQSVMNWNVLDMAAFVAMVALAGGALLALWVVRPRTPGSLRGYLFWEAIAEHSAGRQYSDELWTLTPATLFQIKAEHCYDLARVCRKKYKFVRVAIWFCAAGLVASLVVFLFAAPRAIDSESKAAVPPAAPAGPVK